MENVVPHFQTQSPYKPKHIYVYPNIIMIYHNIIIGTDCTNPTQAAYCLHLEVFRACCPQRRGARNRRFEGLPWLWDGCFFPCLPTDRVKITCVNYGNTEIGHINAWLIPTVAHVLLWQGGGIKHREDECIPCVAQSQTRSFMVSYAKGNKSCSRSDIYGMWGYHRTTSGMNM